MQMSGNASSFLRSGRRSIELSPDDVCFDPPTWSRPVDRRSAVQPKRPEAVDDAVSPISSPGASPPANVHPVAVLQETIRRSEELTDELRRARSNGGPPPVTLTNGSPQAAAPTTSGDSSLLMQLHQLVFQHQHRIDQLDDALRVERKLRLELERHVMSMVHPDKRSSGEGATRAAAVPARVAVEMSPTVASPPKYSSRAGAGACASDAGSVAELRSVWRELRDEVPPN